MRCPNCQNELSQDAKFCTRCGVKVMQVDMQPGFNDMQPGVTAVKTPRMQPVRQFGACMSCGAKMESGIKFCTVCGARAGGAMPYLIRFRNNDMIAVDCAEFVIGKKQGAVNYCIFDNRAVSRVHAAIINTGGQFCVMDMGSTNHTYVDGFPIPVHTQVPIEDGTKLCFANEEFEFRIV